MNLLVFEQCPDNRLGGQERSLFEVCQGLAARGAKITLAYRKDGNLLPHYQNFCENTIELPGHYFVRPAHAFSFINTLIRLAWRNRSARWDALYVNQYGDSPLAAALGLLLQIPLFAHLRLPAGSRLSKQYQWALRRCSALIAISEFTKEQYANSGILSDKIRVIYNGANLKHFIPVDTSHDSRRNILYLGRITPHKGLSTLVDAYECVLQKRSDISLTIVGDVDKWDVHTAYLDELRKKAAELGGPIVFLPNQADVRPLLASSDLLVLPSNWGEPFGRVLIEAMAMGIPVVATRDGGIPEVLSDHFDSHLVPPGNPKALAAAILKFIDWRTENPGLGAEFRRYVESRFDQAQTHDKIFSLFAACIHKGITASA